MDEKRMTGVKSSGCNMEELQDASQASLEYLGSLCALFAKKNKSINIINHSMLTD